MTLKMTKHKFLAYMQWPLEWFVNISMENIDKPKLKVQCLNASDAVDAPSHIAKAIDGRKSYAFSPNFFLFFLLLWCCWGALHIIYLFQPVSISNKSLR